MQNTNEFRAFYNAVEKVYDGEYVPDLWKISEKLQIQNGARKDDRGNSWVHDNHRLLEVRTYATSKNNRNNPDGHKRRGVICSVEEEDMGLESFLEDPSQVFSELPEALPERTKMGQFSC